jgi:hypothetical protein|tara:strand:- start:3708 stop:3869 length:162 start_codon:yes stop_codon:yes gene_type:complete
MSFGKAAAVKEHVDGTRKPHENMWKRSPVLAGKIDWGRTRMLKRGPSVDPAVG